MHRQHPLNRLYLNNYGAVHKHVETISIIELKVVVKHGDDLFGYDVRACFPNSYVRQVL